MQAKWECEEWKNKPLDLPPSGSVEFTNYSTSYLNGKNCVLKNLTLKINPKEKIGICGRTGVIFSFNFQLN